MRIARRAVSVLLLVATSACYHATILTGRPEGTQKIEKKISPAWIAGLIPPKTVETAQACPNGVARVETQMSFVDMVISAVTFNIFTPMDITVTCAAAGTANGSSVKSDGDATEALLRAVELSSRLHKPVDVRF